MGGIVLNKQTWKTELCARYPYRIEMHAHTKPVSSCSEILPHELVDTYKQLGYDALVVTNHFMRTDRFTRDEYIDWYLNGYEETKRCGEAMGLRVYLGAEIRFTENNNDYLVFGVDRAVLEDIYDRLHLGVEAFRKEYSMPNSVFIQAHPMRDGMVSVAPHLLDGVEVFNMHPGHNSRVGLAALFAKEVPHPVITAGSDYHHANRHHEGVAALKAARLPADSFELADLLREGDYLLEIGREHLILP